MPEQVYDIIVIGAGSAGLSVGLTMNELGFSILMIARNNKEIGGECLNDGCIPSKALIHVAKIVSQSREASQFGWDVSGKTDLKKTMEYVYQRQEKIRVRENADWLQANGIDVELGNAVFSGKNEVEMTGSGLQKRFIGRKIVIATGSQARKLTLPGIEMVTYYDNENIFHADHLPENLLVVGAGPIGIEIAQAFCRMGSKVTVIDRSPAILEHDDKIVTDVLLEQLKKEGIEFILNVQLKLFLSPNEALIELENGQTMLLHFDCVFSAIGRQVDVGALQLSAAGIDTKDGKIVVNGHLQTSNKNVFVCGDVAGDLKFSHAAEFHARILVNNFLSPFKKKLDNKHMSWVTFSDPEIASFGLNEKQLVDKNIKHQRLEEDFSDDDRAVSDNYQYGKMILYISSGGFLHKSKILGGSMVAPHAGELVQELILAMSGGLSIDSLFNKIYPYPVAARINQKIIIEYKQGTLTPLLKKALKVFFKWFS